MSNVFFYDVWIMSLSNNILLLPPSHFVCSLTSLMSQNDSLTETNVRKSDIFPTMRLLNDVSQNPVSRNLDLNGCVVACRTSIPTKLHFLTC